MKKLIVMLLTLALLCTSFASCSKGGSYDDLAILDLGLEREYFGIAFRAGSDLTRKVEDITVELMNDGTIASLSTKYEVGAVGKEDYTPKADPCEGSGDYDYVKSKGKLTIGITDYKPMDYKDENGEWIGFDADYARAVCEKLGVEAEFKEIEWDYKLVALEAKDIDCIWNGMTITDAIETAADCTAPYMYNTQVAVIKKADAEKYKTLKDLYGVAIAAEAGSAGEKVILADDSLKEGYKGVTAQTDALLEVLSGASAAAVVDLTLAKALIKN
ncbi:MAG: transporter substrate-binding domain-containing protein [Clostridia bacterium]|nr:transporter substrate-binding domain-containing protein [Clostridia bacterium]